MCYILRTESAVQIALRLNSIVCENNFVRFFRLFRHLPPLAQCALYQHVASLQRSGK